MYGQANYGQFGKGPQKPMPSAYQQHLQAPPPPPPPPPPHNFQQGHTTLLPPVTQQAPLARPPQISQLGPRLYHHGLPAQNAYQIPSGVPPLHGPPEILRPPQPYGALPPPPPLSQGQSPYRATVHPPPPPYTGGVQDLRHIPPLPPPSTSGFFTTTTFGSSIPSIIGDSQGSSMAPPPPPSSMPPIPPSPPLSSTLANLGDSNLSVHSDFDPSSNKHSSLERVLDHVDGDVASKDARHNTLMRDGSQSLAARSSCEVGSLAGDGSLFDGSMRLDLRPSPPKPTEEKTVQKIEALCQDIAKNGPNVEVITFQNESRNPEFGFLFGGEPGSEAAIAHEYFQWLKRKCILAYKVHEDKRESALGPFTNDSSSQPNYLMASAGCTSPADSDMEMEDDITFSEKDQEVNHSIEAVGCNSDFVCKEVDVKDRLHGRQILLKGHPVHDMLSEKVLSESSNLHEQSKEPKILYHQDHSTFGKSASGACSPTIEAAECALANNRKRSTSVSPEGSSPSRGSTASKAINLRNSSNQPGKSGSPFRLLQDYASDDSAENDDEPFHEDRNPLAVPPSIKVDSSSSKKATGNRLGSDVGFKSLHRTEKAKVASVGADVISKRDRDLKENEEKEAKFESASPKVDEFGRLVREGSSDSDYDSRYTNRRDKRGRNRSHSRSPIDRSRSSWRRREKRSRSRSWSPRNRRSRSRSPTYRRAGEFGGENMRRDRARLPECFDFRRGRCYRGASCRYMHHEVDKSDRSRHHRSRQNYLDDPLSSSNSKIKEEGKNTSAKVSKHLHDDANSQEIRFSQNVRCATKDGIIDWRRQDIVEDGLQSIKSDHCDKLIDSDAIKCGGPALLSATMSDKGMIQVPDYEKFQEELAPNQPLSVDSFPSRCVSDVDILKSCGDTPQNMLSFVKTSVLQSQSIAKVQNTDSSPQQMTNSSVADSFSVQKSLSSPKKFSNIGTFPKTTLSSQPLPSASSHGQSFSSEPFSLQSLPSKDVSPPSYSAANTSHHLLQLPPPPPLPLAHGSGAAHMPQLPTDQSSIPQIASYPLHSAPVDNLYTSQAPLPNQHSQLPLAPNSSWPSFPPPPPRPYDSSLNSGTATLDVLSQFQHSHFPSRCDFNQSSIRPYPTELPSHSQVGEFLHRAHPSMESHRPTLHMEDFRSGNPPSQPFCGSSPLRDTHFTYHLVRDINSSNSSGQGSLNQQHVPSSQELPVSRMLPFSSDVHPPGEVLKSSSQIHPYSHTQQPSYGMQYSQSDSILSMPGKTVPMPRYPPDLMDRNQSSSNPDFGAPRISAHYNLFASTYEQPLASISSKEFSREKGALNGNKYDAPSGLSHVAVDGHGVGSIGQRQTTSSPRSARAVEQSLHGLGGDQYDPLFDSIDPLSKPQRKNDHGQKPELTSDSDLMVRLSGSNKPLDLEENNRHKEVETVASATSLDNDEYGETADAEVGVIEEESFSNPDGEATAGENEIDQKKSPGKSKKKKDSRSTKLFKVSIANFVKEVLKPSWREGNMSKEAFKTIVKKTVDKVSGAMKSHQVPKSQAKIDHYIDSSQRKLTKLVMGYVDKYVKV